MKEGWEMKRLGDVCKVLKRKHSGASLPYIGMEDIESSTGQLITAPTEKTVKSTSFQFNEKHILYGRLRPYLNKVFLPDFNGHCSTEIFPIECADNLDRRFLFFWLTKSRTVQKIDVTSTGTRMPRANIPTVLDFQIPVPPLPEQRRIVAILDEALAAIATATANAKKNLAHAQELFESELNRVFTQRGDGWSEKRLGDLSEIQSGGTPLRSIPEYWGQGIAWYSSGELNDLLTTVPERNITTAGLANSNAKLFPKGSLLIGMYDTAALKMSILDRDAAFNQAIAGMKPNPKVNLFFVNLALRAIRENVLHLRRGVRQKNLSLGKIKDIIIALPELKDQNAIVADFVSLRKNIECLESIYQQKLKLFAELKQSLLHKAFSGELTADPKAVEETVSEEGG